MKRARSRVLLLTSVLLLGCSEPAIVAEPLDVEPVVEAEPDRDGLLQDVMIPLNVRHYYDEALLLEDALDNHGLLETYDFQQGWYDIVDYWVENEDHVVIETYLDQNGRQQTLDNREVAFRICEVVQSAVEWASTVEVTDRYGGRIAMCGRNPDTRARG